MKHWFGNSLRGVCMGVADVIPGVSGGTVALILGIYPRLVGAVGSVGTEMLRRIRRRSFRLLVKEGLRDPGRLGDTPDGTHAGHVLLLASVVAGIVPAIAVGAQVLPPLLSAHPEQMRGLFLGLVAASVTIPARQIRRRSLRRWLLAAGAAVLTAWFVGLPEPSTRHAGGTVTLEFAEPVAGELRLTPRNLTLTAPGEGGGPDIDYGLRASRIVPAGATTVEVEIVARMAGGAANLPPGSLRVSDGTAGVSAAIQAEALTGGRDPGLGYVFLGGVLAISAMVLPGISGSFVLLLLGLYHFVLYSLALALRHGDPGGAVVVATMLAAVAVGLLTFSRVLKHLFARWRGATLAVLVGLMTGSLRKLWPFVDHAAGGREVMTLPGAGDPEVVTVGLMFCAGVAAVLLLDAMGRRM
ncbi:MAG: DUF368 domain-containing protein [Gemmatimonadota bacterium]|nr:DUF368 domain-containing protein [Gemmatimonadota bacterium]MDE2873454.1 DUF368 domain-containing protein [Gemmatimonadota bacterium]